MVKSYGSHTVLVAGLARASASTPIAVQYDQLLVVLILDKESGRIIDADCNMVLDVTSEFISSLLRGRCFYTDLERMVSDILTFYQGVNQRALVICLRDAYAKMYDRGTQYLPLPPKRMA